MKIKTKLFRAEMKLRGKIARRLSWLGEWQQALHHAYVHAYARAVPKLAYVYVENANYRGDIGR